MKQIYLFKRQIIILDKTIIMTKQIKLHAF